MAYPVRARFDTGKTTLYALIQSLEFGTSMWWNNATSHWDTPLDGMVDATTPAPGSFIALTESAEKGIYTGSFTNLTPVNGTTYRVWVMDGVAGMVNPDSESVYYRMSDDCYFVSPLTTLQIINRVQRRLRLPESSALTDSHASLMLRFVNDAYLTILPSMGILSETRVHGSFSIRPGLILHPIYPINKQRVDRLNWIKYRGKSPSEYPLNRLSNEDFEEAMNIENENPAGYPKYFRVKENPEHFPCVDFYPGLDADLDIYLRFDYECMIKPVELSAASDTPMCDPIALEYGAAMLAKQDAGLDFTTEANLLGQLLEVKDINSDSVISEINC